MKYFKYESPVGPLYIRLRENKIIELDYTEKKWEELKESSKIKEYLDDYFAGKNPLLHTLTYHLEGTEYQMAVWKELEKIPYGTTVTYKDISEKLKSKGLRSSPQSVGGAVGKNPINIIVPCHRVVGSDGSLTGYRGGLERKKKLLQLEGVIK